jgi:hypothetical protein
MVDGIAPKLPDALASRLGHLPLRGKQPCVVVFFIIFFIIVAGRR